MCERLHRGSNVKRRLQTPLVVFLLFLAVWAPRVPALNAFVTPDERLWLFRSANFYQAISRGDFAHTFQREHPGVTVMWAGTLAFLQLLPGYAKEASGQVARDQLEPWLREHSTIEPLQMLAAARWWMVLWIALITVAAYFPLRKLFGPQIAVLAVLVMAWDPFFIALSRLLHLDGLLASLTMFSLLAFLAWLHGGQQRRYFVVSSLAAGLAMLTKIPAAVLLPTTGLLLFLEWFRRIRAGEGKSLGLLLAFVAWVVLVAVTFVALWPSMWVAPLHVLSSIVSEMRKYSEGHDNPMFFLGRPTENPGPFFYPVAYLFRTTPAVLIGLVAAVALEWKRQWPFDAPVRRRSALGLVIFVLFFAAVMTLSAKKFDRYLSPAIVVLDIVAALGWLGLTQTVLGWWHERRSRTSSAGAPPAQSVPSRLSVWVVLSVIFLLHGLFAFTHYPYYFTYYNPLVGGSRTAPGVLMAGWGEGLDAAARWLNQQPSAAELRVVSGYSQGPLSYFMQPGRMAWALSDTSTLQLVDADYVVLYVYQWQRGLPSPEMVDYYLAREPAHIVRSGGLELARIYDVRNEAPPPFLQIVTASAANFGDRMRLAGYHLEPPSLSSDPTGVGGLSPGDRVMITLYLRKLADAGINYDVLLRLVGPDGAEIWRDEGWSAANLTPAGWSAEEVFEDNRELVIPDEVPPGLYKLMLSFYDPRNGELLPIAGGGVSHEVTRFEVKAPGSGAPSASSSASGSSGQFVETGVSPQMRARELDASWSEVQLRAVQHAPQMTPGQTLRVELAVKGRADESRKFSARLVDPAGTVEAQTDVAARPLTRIDLDLPDDAKPGIYKLVVVLYDSATQESFADSTGNFVTALSEVEVVAAAR
jgi:4-amino-4-deoxy-L-arabinose transferase-like glycosyltransferase